MSKTKYLILPILACLTGMIIHFLGFIRALEITSISNDAMMFVIDTIVLIGILKKRTWGWYLGVILFLQQSIMQPYWAYELYKLNQYVLLPVERVIASAIVIMCLIILLTHRNYFNSK